MRNTALFLTALFFLCLPHTAAASYWIGCKVVADVATAEKERHYAITIRSAEIREGHAEKGSACLEEKIGTTVTVKGDDLPTGKNRILRYEFYNDRTEEGVINQETWTVAPRLWHLY